MELPQHIQNQIITLTDELKYHTRRARECQSALDAIASHYGLASVRLAVVAEPPADAPQSGQSNRDKVTEKP